ncbi:undecaprenyl-diphosphate phosphatase [Alicyclobacillus sp. ALC3]|uniref:undecaprenyl-diphosphate phosphatase n=1 Tax=Alicyclobacillus sp. ALC3 TaxID=2796143 RepID=UPI002377DF57|nr:undecaprenyl-diphosphate phosphatase [Alicyclobacillus sp. ALC3]WDL97217.1 undecaprenyl-diphosphate phosphatase [Alicyclobacillus sp. ALC3]
MSWLQAVVFGAVQGITEFLPISSSGHLVLLQKLWHLQGDNLLFFTLLHIGTLIAVVWAFSAEVKWLLRHPFSWPARMIFLACIPTAFVGGLFEDLFEHLFQSGVTIGFEFILTGVILWWMDSAPDGGLSTMDDIRATDALWIGVFQGAAILPALSRSGLTIAGGLWRGLSRDTAARFSFLLSIPAILGATVVEFDDAIESPAHFALPWSTMLLGTAAAVVAGYVSVRATLWLVRRAKMRVFAVYVWVIAAFILADQVWFHHWFPSLLG